MNRDLIKSNTVFNPTGLFDALFNETLNSMYPAASRITSSLRSDYFMENDEVVLNVDVAGATPEDVNVSFNKEKSLLFNDFINVIKLNCFNNKTYYLCNCF